MKRKAILIESSSVRGHHDLPGARVDLSNWVSFLKTDYSGSWEDSEIIPLKNPSSTKVIEELKVTPDCYCFVAFSGHGSNGFVVLNDFEQTVPITKFKPSCQRSSVVIDACRGEEKASARSFIRKMAQNESTALNVLDNAQNGLPTHFSARISAANSSFLECFYAPSKHRQKWETALGACGIGTVEMLACAPGQGAQEDPEAGGYYTSLLLQGVELWQHRVTTDTVYTTKHAHDYARVMMTAPQTPEYRPPNLAFPFGVKA